MTRPDPADPRIAVLIRKRAQRLPLTQTETAALLGMSHQRVHTAEKRAIEKIRECLLRQMERAS